MKTFKGYEYIVYWFKEAGHFNGYVRLPDDHKFTKLIDRKETIYGRELTVGYNDIDIDCHGGLTFGEIIKDNKKTPQGFSKGAWIGWDYAHLLDKTAYYGGIEHTEDEVETECKNVIEQLIALK